MTVLLCIASGILCIALVVLAATRPPRASVSLFELRRRKEAKSKTAQHMLRREELLGQLGALKAPLSALLLLLLLLTLVHAVGRSNGMIATIAVGLLYSRIAQVRFVQKLATAWFRRYEARLLGVAAKYEPILRVIGGKQTLRETRLPLASREELAQVLEESDIFSKEDRVLLEHALKFKDRKVKQCMVPKEAMVTVKSTELLGPLVLDGLHKTGHTIFPVTKGKDIVGLLDSSDHVALRSKESVHVRSVMHTDITKIDQSAHLDEALQVFIEAKQPLLIVVDDDNQVAGLLSLGDTVRALTGWKHQ